MSTPYLELLNWVGEAIKLGAMPLWHYFHTDDPFGDGPPRETNAAGYLIRMAKVPRNQDQVVKVKRGIIRTRVRVLVLRPPRTWSPRSRQDRQRICLAES